MKITKLNLVNFRNYSSLNINFHSGLTILAGENAQGKTNILEAIFLLSLAKSHRTNHDQEMIQWDKKIARIEGLIKKENNNFPLEIILTSQGKIAKYNHLDQKKLSQFVGKLNVILFAPEDMQLIKGGPQLRRKFIDTELGQAHPVYLQCLLDYQRILKQRNAYLKLAREKNQIDPVYFNIITEQLVAEAVKIIGYRLEFIEGLENIAQSLHFNLSNQRDHLTINYRPSSSKLDYSILDSLEDQFHQLFNGAIEREQSQGITLYGPHRDDIEFYINDNLAQQFASQGQQRTIVLSLKLAELELIYQLTKDYPVLLLDDVLSELDDQRQMILMNQIEGKVQTILTTASIESIQQNKLQNSKILKISQGQIISEGD